MMMRSLSAGAVALVILATPAFALDGGDTMQAWAGASSKEKVELLEKLDGAGGQEASRDRVRACLDQTAKTSGHSALPISEVAKACVEQSARENI